MNHPATRSALLFAAALFSVGASLSTTALAQPRTPDPQRVEAVESRLAGIRARLALTAEQEEAVEPILRASLDRRIALMEAARGEGRPNRREMRRLRAEAEKIRDETRAALAAVLTPEQLAEYDLIQKEIRAEARERMRERRRAR